MAIGKYTRDKIPHLREANSHGGHDEIRQSAAVKLPMVGISTDVASAVNGHGAGCYPAPCEVFSYYFF